MGKRKIIVSKLLSFTVEEKTNTTFKSLHISKIEYETGLASNNNTLYEPCLLSCINEYGITDLRKCPTPLRNYVQFYLTRTTSPLIIRSP